MRRRAFVFALVLLAMTAGCASLIGIRQQPEITLTGIELLELGFLEQRFNLKLRVQNPNDVALAINGMNFEVELNGQSFAKGLSDQAVTVPRMGEAVLDVKATSSLASVWKQLQEMKNSERKAIDYRLFGRISLAGLGSVPFEKKGSVIAP